MGNSDSVDWDFMCCNEQLYSDYKGPAVANGNGQGSPEQADSFQYANPGAPDYNPVVLVSERDGELIGGLSGYSLYGWLCIEVLWVAEHERGRGIGRALMSEAEVLALKRRCTGIHLDTFDFRLSAGI